MISKSVRHPGPYVRVHVIPEGMSVTEAAKRLNVGRPALSNFLNGKAALSPEMATRLKKVFGADREKLLEMQAAFSGDKQATREQPAVNKGYMPSVLTITAQDIEGWANRINARHELAVLLRRLINSTSADLHAVDFPGFDNAERPGWDGFVNADTPTPWIPAGKSVWEFGCNKDLQSKANEDFATRTKSVSEKVRADFTFVFVTPRNWPKKKDWIESKRNQNHWKDVRAYDASDLEQWLEVSAPTQIWLAEQMGIPVSGYRSLSRCWDEWSEAGKPKLGEDLFAPAIKNFKNTFSEWLKSKPDKPFVIAADSTIEALAFLSCMAAELKLNEVCGMDQAIVFDAPEAVSRLTSASNGAFLVVAASHEVECQLATYYRRFHCIIVRPRNLVDSKPDIELGLLRPEDFRAALSQMGIGDDESDRLDRESGRSPTILRRRLSKIDAIRRPPWAEDKETARDLIAPALIGAWNAESKADREVISLLADKDHDIVEECISEIMRSEDSPLWSIGKYRGVASKTDALFAVNPFITKKNLDDFFLAAEYVLSEKDPALELPEDKRPFAGLFGKVRDHSPTLRNGICETLVLLAVHGNEWMHDRLCEDIKGRVDTLVSNLLSPLNSEGLLSNNHDLPNYAEAAPVVFLDLIEKDLSSNEPVVFQLLKPADSPLFGGGCPRTGLLWALECLAWKPQRLLRVTKILATLSTKKIEDNWGNKPEETLKSIFRSWLPQTSASVEERIKALEYLTKHEPNVAWDLCTEQIEIGSSAVGPNYRPRWRDDASGAGQSVTRGEILRFERKAIGVCLGWPNHNEHTLGDLVERLQALNEEDQTRVWYLIDLWIKTNPDDEARASLRERIRLHVFRRRGHQREISKTNAARASAAFERLTPRDLIVRHQWLFVSHWVDVFCDEIENVDLDHKERRKRVKTLRTEALSEIWQARGFDGIWDMLKISGANRIIGSIMPDLLRRCAQRISFVESCLLYADGNTKSVMQDCLLGFFDAVDKRFIGELVGQIGEQLTEEQLVMLFISLPFRGPTWQLLANQPEQIRKSYWEKVNPYWSDFSSDEINTVIDSLLEANRPVAAFHAVHLSSKDVDSTRLFKLLRAVATTSNETPPTFRLRPHDISDAFKSLDSRADVPDQEKANLEYMFFGALEHSRHGIPNLERQIAVSPELYFEAIRIAFKRDDDGTDPEEWTIVDPEKHGRLVAVTYRLLERIRRMPGTDGGTVKIEGLKEWLRRVRDLCKKYGRADVGDQMIGQFLSRSQADEDGNWPSRPICEALEWMDSEEVGRGFYIGTRNSRGVYVRGDGGDQEREIAQKYRSFADRVRNEFPYVGSLLDDIAVSYDYDAKGEDTDAKLRRRIPY